MKETNINKNLLAERKKLVEETLGIAIDSEIVSITDTHLTTRRANGTIRIRSVNLKPTRTQAHEADAANINAIVKKYHATGELPQNMQWKAMDLSAVPDYQTMLQTVIHAENAFNALPSQIRKRFDNDPQQLLNFVNDPKNTAEAVKLGLRQEIPLSDTQKIVNSVTDLNKNLSQTIKKTGPTKNKNDDLD